jgi:hypothetical protein
MENDTSYGFSKKGDIRNNGNGVNKHLFLEGILLSNTLLLADKQYYENERPTTQRSGS